MMSASFPLSTALASTLDSQKLVVNPPNHYLWDFAGVDGLQAAIALFTPFVSHIAPFQSLETTFQQHPCSVLRLCENNFRVAFPTDIQFDAVVAALGLKVWVKPCAAAVLVLSPEVGLRQLAAIATTKPIYTLTPFPRDRAVPARINGIAILAWHHGWQGQLRLEIQTTGANLDVIRSAFIPDASTN